MSLPQHGHFGCAGTTATDADWRTQWINNLFQSFFHIDFRSSRNCQIRQYPRACGPPTHMIAGFLRVITTAPGGLACLATSLFSKVPAISSPGPDGGLICPRRPVICFSAKPIIVVKLSATNNVRAAVPLVNGQIPAIPPPATLLSCSPPAPRGRATLPRSLSRLSVGRIRRADYLFPGKKCQIIFRPDQEV